MDEFEDDDFDFDDTLFDESAMRQLDEIEARHTATKTAPLFASTPKHASTSKQLLPARLSPQLNQVVKESNKDAAQMTRPIHRTIRSLPSASRDGRNLAGPSRQTNLFGEILSTQNTQGVFIQANKANSAIGPASQQASQVKLAVATILATSQRNKTKQWDFAQPMMRPKKAVTKFELDDFDEFADDSLDAMIAKDVQFEMPPPPIVEEVNCLRAMKVKIDREAAKTWIYPTNKEKRDYQYNIVQRALFNNVLVALPTGLGKTFIAAVVILNYFRWFPEGKIIFVAPTKPLVAQQQSACHGICGLPWDTAIEMTGETKASLRAEEWKTKRIFYMTPQTFENDLCSTAINAQDVVCVVVDEAHRATGNYAYGKVIRHLMIRNPFFRVLALTATPGSNSDKVQEVVDSLHINLIEIRQEDALDIRSYIHSKEEDPVVVPMKGVVGELRDMMCKLMRPHMDILHGAGLLMQKDPVCLAPFAVRSIYTDPRKKSIVAQRKLYQNISTLADLAQAMECLVKFSVKMFASKMLAVTTGTGDRGKQASNARQQIKFQSNTIVSDMRRLYEECQGSDGAVPHPKMEYLLNVIASHFQSPEGEEGRKDTRVMVFCSYRECVTELVDLLNGVPSVRATQFVGQSTDKKGNRGLRQVDQERVVDDFKRGNFNVLVATSIGEEGLDIGEVDLIVCYEAVKNAVRMLQRIGRTGRKRQGRVVVLMSEGPEEKNWQQSKDRYRTIQHDIIKGINLSLYDDVERLVPADITSEPRLLDVDQPPFEPSMIREQSKRGAARGAKRKRNSDPMRNIPAGVSTGFVKVSALRKSGTSSRTGKGKGKHRGSDLREGDDESSDLGEVDLGLPFDTPQAPSADIDLSDESDSTLERGLIWHQPAARQIITQEETGVSDIQANASYKLNSPRGRSLGTRRIIRKDQGRTDNLPRIISLVSSQDDLPTQKAAGAVARSRLTEAAGNEGVTALRGEDDESEIIVPADATNVSSSPVVRRRVGPHPLISQLASEIVFDQSDDDMDLRQGCASKALSLDAEQSPLLAHKRNSVRRSRPVTTSSSPPNTATMGPPALPTSEAKRSKGDARLRTAASKKPGALTDKAKRRKRIGNSPTSRRLFQTEADESDGEGGRQPRDIADDCAHYEEDSSDREHVGDFQPTQAPKGYKQQDIYLQSLNTQTAPSPFQKRTPARVPSLTSPRLGDSSTSHLQGDDDSGNEYEMGSFVCSDDDVVFASSQSICSNL